MTFNIADLYASLEMMWKGMTGLFAVCIFIMLLSMLIYKITSAAGKKKANQENVS